MQKLEAFLPRLLVWTPGVPEPLAYQALIDSCIAFCEDTHVVRYISYPTPEIAGQGEYDLDIPRFCDISRLMRVWYGTLQWASQVPMKYGLVDQFTVAIWPVPNGTPGVNTGRDLFFEVATKPQRTATQVDDSLLRDWVEGVVGGAMMRICSMPDQPYTNPTTAQLGAAMYNKWKGKAQFEKNKDRLQRDTVVRARPFASGRKW